MQTHVHSYIGLNKTYSLDETFGKTAARFLNTVFIIGNLVPSKDNEVMNIVI